MLHLEVLVRMILVGLAATAILDLWLLLLGRLGVPTLGMALVGRWAGHLLRGKVVHAAIRQSPPIRGEQVLGWAVHYAIGAAFAALLTALAGAAWLQRPTIAPALAVGIATVAAPLLVLQPAMGAGIASSRTPAPVRNSLRSALNHGVFGLGLYLAALAVSAVHA